MKNMWKMIVFVGVLMGAVSCGDPAAGPGQSAIMLIVDAEQYGKYVDVYDATLPAKAQDSLIHNIKILPEKKDQSDNAEVNVYSDVILEQYTVTYWRSDGSPNVPKPISVGLSVRVPHDGEFTFKDLMILPRDAKLQSPLKELAFGGGEGSILMNALVKFYGHDLSNNAVMTQANFVLFVQDLPGGEAD